MNKSGHIEPNINHWNMVDFRQTVTRDELKYILLHYDNIIRAGKLCDVKTKHLGVGVYQIWYEERIK